jgi:hypothetical protein
MLTLLSVVAACTSGGGASPTRPKSPAALSNNDPGCQFIVAGTDKRQTVPLINQSEFLVNAAATPTVCYDKISFVFEVGNGPDLPPAYTVQYKTGPFLPGTRTSTEDLPGVHAILEVTIFPASVNDNRNPNNQPSTYQGNLRLSLQGTRHTLIVELLRTFPEPPDPNQSVVVWLIGLDSKRPFTTDAANQPPRVNVLVMN